MSSALAILFGGSLIDAAATFVIALLVQPFVGWLRRTGLPPFFSLLLGAAFATLLVALAVWTGADVDPGLLMTASLIQFLPQLFTHLDKTARQILLFHIFLILFHLRIAGFLARALDARDFLEANRQSTGADRGVTVQRHQQRSLQKT